MASIVNTTSNPSTKQLVAGEYWNDNNPIEDSKLHASAVISIHSDQPSSVDGIECRWSIDMINWDFYDRFTLSLSDLDTVQTLDGCLTKTINIEHRARYFGVRYINGPNDCSSLRIQTIHKAIPQSSVIENTVQTTVSGLVFAGENLKTTVGKVSSASTVLRTYSDGIVYDGSFTSEDSTTYDFSQCNVISLAGRALKDGTDVSFVFALYVCSEFAHGTPNSSTTDGNMFDTGHRIQNLNGGTFYATYTNIAAPYISLKNITGDVPGNPTDVCLSITGYCR